MSHRERTLKPLWHALVALVWCVPSLLSAQCTTTITTFPHTEDLEAGPAWTSGGTNSDWAWGVPAHPTINAAANGVNAWCVGGLTGSFYSNGQQSWLETPCFDLSGLSYPWVSFSIWWETEPNYDGVGFQYSPNGGTTWINVGAEGDAEDCHTANWFNSANITALNLASPRSGWSGTSITGGCASGGGSNGYVTASHCLSDLPSADPVKFRFIFGAGTICNTFDGAAIDAFYLGEAPDLDPSFTYTCAGNTISFTGSGLAGCVADGVWSFGDPPSGAANSGTGTTVSHTYPGPGEYTVTFTMTSSCSAPVTVDRTIVIPQLAFDITDVSCAPNSGAVTANITGGSGPYTYDWEPGGETTQTIDGLAPGSYTVLVQATDMCPVQGTATVQTIGTSIELTEEHEDVACNGASDGSATVTASGGSGFYTYAWSPSGGTNATATGLAPGAYTCTVEDDAGCSAEVEVTIDEPTAVSVVVDAGGTICLGQSTTLVAEASGGSGPFTFAWSPAGPDVEPTATTVYEVVATDANGCSSDPAQTTVTVSGALEPSFSWDVDEGCAPVCVTFTDETAAAGVRSWSFSDGGAAGDVTTPQHCFAQAGSFGATLTVVSAEGCTGTITVADIISVFPNPTAAFRPSPDVALIDDPSFRFLDNSSDATTWRWSFGDPLNTESTEVSPEFTYPAVGCYVVSLTVSNEGGCTDSEVALVCVEDAFALYVPNCFSPNNDAINDEFGVLTTVSDPESFLLTIYDRWGRVLYSTDDPYKGWDGSGQPIGVYAWQVRLRDREGDLQQRQGHVTLVR
ncbi:MAG: PKD domain-containing protein [Flavobacteriales bacterium]|nr:PKD domain-containing protein [Flavobacteriales bacterium]